MPKLSNVSSRYGAPMGRGGVEHGLNSKVSLQKIPLDSGGYDSGGAYWGWGMTLWWAVTEDGEFERFFRAPNRQAAKADILKDWPEAKFYR